MYNNPYYSQINLDKIDKQIADLERIKAQIQQPIQQPTSLTQNFQLAPQNLIKYVSSVDEVQKTSVMGDTPFFSKEMTVLWVKTATGDVKTYELKEIIPKDEKDVQIEFLQAQIEELKRGMINNAKSNDEYANESIESEKSTNVKDGGASTKKSK